MSAEMAFDFCWKKTRWMRNVNFNAVTNAERWTINFTVQHPNIALSFYLFHFIELTSFLYACVYHSRPLFCLFSLSFMLYLRRAYLTNFASYIHNNICLYVVVRPLFIILLYPNGTLMFYSLLSKFRVCHLPICQWKFRIVSGHSFFRSFNCLLCTIPVLTMTGCEPQISVVGSDRSTNCVATTAHRLFGYSGAFTFTLIFQHESMNQMHKQINWYTFTPHDTGF